MASSTTTALSELAELELRLRLLLPADLYAVTWVNPSPATLMHIFEHLRTLQHLLSSYVPRDVCDRLPRPGYPQHCWQTGSLLFTDLAGFTRLLEASASQGRSGAETLLNLLNRYFTQMIEIISKSGGNLLEFTGDALLVEFTCDDSRNEVEQAVHAGLRMQRAMREFANLDMLPGLTLKMRVGIHAGSFVTADIGTPMRMGHVLLGQAVQIAKQAEGEGEVGCVSLTQVASDRLGQQFRLRAGHPGHMIIMDDLTAEGLGEYDIAINRRPATPILLDRSPAGLIAEIQATVQRVEPLASYLPRSVLQLLVDNAAQRNIPPAFPTIAVAFVNLMGLPESVDDARPEEISAIVNCFSQAFALMNGAVERRGGILQKVTYHSIGSEVLIHFGVLNPDESDAQRAVEAILAIRHLISQIPAPEVQGKAIELNCRIGLTYGPVFAAEIGALRGRREFNVLGDTVNTAARLMSRAEPDQILVSEALYQQLGDRYQAVRLGQLLLKGKTQPQPVYSLS
ncbi:MAG: adenylate/guanylate cyclase domain-containing protein [Leptolyngbyaceae cyanobacterium SM1_1_3]|nr:adenylate/guanylate cyclase domain-containing protein [Leptolyngbyaceae cyanobacterium SM1_1_3]NJN03251.1 adenylate/guanylate cyclase domain-containing protein [Leptolyngbyaceae cyanobacterium RM1_1_2]NJO11215.1 adenylate/guanylate cyclase domain-containing protein [Leptolyngbyaceae cyanobacterium SL_1_1]